MSLIASSNGSYQLPSEGNHLARCVRVIDLGTQCDEYKGKSKRLHKVMISWELPTEKTVFDEERGEEPFLVSKKYTLALGEKANLRRDLESWRGKGFTEAELEAFDISKLLGAACMVNIIHRTSAKKRKYASVTGITPLPKGMKDSVPTQVLPTIKYLVEDGTHGAFELLPEFVQKEIMASEEWEQVESTSDDEPRADEPEYKEPEACSAVTGNELTPEQEAKMNALLH